MADAKELLAAKRIAYRHAFTSPDGQIALADLEERFNRNLIRKDKQGRVDEVALQVAVGARSVILYIEEMMREDI